MDTFSPRFHVSACNSSTFDGMLVAMWTVEKITPPKKQGGLTYRWRARLRPKAGRAGRIELFADDPNADSESAQARAKAFRDKENFKLRTVRQELYSVQDLKKYNVKYIVHSYALKSFSDPSSLRENDDELRKRLKEELDVEHVKSNYFDVLWSFANSEIARNSNLYDFDARAAQRYIRGINVRSLRMTANTLFIKADLLPEERNMQLRHGRQTVNSRDYTKRPGRNVILARVQDKLDKFTLGCTLAEWETKYKNIVFKEGLEKGLSAKEALENFRKAVQPQFRQLADAFWLQDVPLSYHQNYAS